MRAVCVLAARRPRDADAMASVLQVISAIERIGNAAVDIARIVTHRLGIPRALVADLSTAEEVSHRVRVREGSPHGPPAAADARAAGRRPGMRVVAIRRGPGLDHRRRRRRDLRARRRAVPAGFARRHRPAAGAGGGARVGAAEPRRRTAAVVRPRPGGRRAGRDEEHLRGRGRPGLLGPGAAGPGAGRRGQPSRGPARRDAGAPRALGAAGGARARRPVAAARAAPAVRRGRGDRRRRPSRWCGSIEQKEELHPILRLALGRGRRGGRARAGGRRLRCRRPVAGRAAARDRDRASTCSPSAAAAGTCTGPAADVVL